MMKTTVICFAALLSLAARGQDALKGIPPTASKGIFIGASFSPDYSFRTLNNTNGNPISNLFLSTRNEVEMPKFGYTTGLNLYMGLTKNVLLESGIQYANKGYQTKRQALIFEQPGPNSPTSLKTIYTYHYIDIPIKMDLILGNGKLRFLSSVGFCINMLTRKTETQVVEYPGSKKTRNNSFPTSSYNKVNISPQVSVGIDYKISGKMNVRLDPTFRYGVLKVIDEPVSEYLWNAGLNTGLYYRLK